jgi:peptidyl-prolyl cis-trans isomerase C
MKVLVAVCLPLLAASVCFGQANPTPSGVPRPLPGTPTVQGGLPSSPSTPAAAPVSPDTVVASVQGKPITAGEIEEFVKGFPPQVRQTYSSNPRDIVKQFLVFRYIAAMAEKNKLDQKSPTREQLVFMRTQALWQAQVQAVSMEMNAVPEDYEKYYSEHKDRFTQAKVKAIYIPYTGSAEPGPPNPDPKAKKPLTEEQAKVRAEEASKAAKSGADFLELVKKYSEDPQSSKSGGDLPPISKSDALPESLKTVIFALKKGEVSDPVKHTNGYYVFRGEGSGTKTIDEVRDQINQELKGERMKQWMAKTEKEADVKIENESFFSQAPKAAK